MTLSCLEFRQRVGAVPGTRDGDVAAHRAGCRACAAFADEQAALDHRLHAALRIPVPDDLAARVIWSQSATWKDSSWLRSAVPSWQWAGLAAGLLLAALLGVLVSGQRVPGRGLPAEIVEHIEHEPARLVFSADTRMAQPVQVSAVLESGGVYADEPPGNVVTAGLCPFRGHQVPHLVMNIDGEPVSVLLLARTPSQGVREIHEDGYHGLLVPHENGSIAIVAPRPELIQPVREQLQDSVHWQPL